MGSLKVCVVAAVAAVCVLVLPTGQAAIHSVITEWITIAQDNVVRLHIEHQQAARLYATLASAQYDAIVAAKKSGLGVTDDAAAAFASHAVLSSWFNWIQSYTFDPTLARQLASIGVSDSDIAVLKSVVLPVVKQILSKRLGDNSSAFANFRPLAPTNTSADWGRYQTTDSNGLVHYPQVAVASGFYLSSKEVDILTATLKHFKLDDPKYAEQLEQTYRLGSATSTNRTAYDTESAYFWSQGDGTSTLAGFWIDVAVQYLPESTPLIAQARVLKLMATSFWDTGVACWRVKYRELFWRPITAIRTGHGVRPADPAWTPLLTTPIDPEYASSHMCTTGAALYLLETLFGANTPFSSASQSGRVGVRSYNSFREAALEVGMSRVYAGVHLAKSNVDGMSLGYTIAKRIHDRYFKGAILADGS